MRQIKFRAWHIEKKRWIDLNGMSTWFGTHPNKGAIYAVSEQGVLREYDHDEIEIVQYTGLKDKSGKEIYEGDIVKFHYFYMTFGENMGAQESEHELTGIVKWQEYGYGLDAIKGEHWAGYTGYSDNEGYSDFLHLVAMSESSVHEESFEIIGNIYETSDLIK